MNVKDKILKMSLAKKLVILVLLVCAGVLIKTQVFKPKAQVQYRTAKVEKGTIISTVSASGSVSSANTVPITTQVSGVVTDLYVKNGNYVKSGAPIAKLDLDQNSNQSYLQQLSSYNKAKSAVDSAELAKYSLESSLISAQKTFQDAINDGKDKNDQTYQIDKNNLTVSETKYNNQDEVISQARADLYNSWLSLTQVSPTIYASISGTVDGLSFQIGSVLSAKTDSSTSKNVSQSVGNIVVKAPVAVTVNVTEIDAPKIKNGQRATVTLDAFPNETFTGKVLSVDVKGVVSSGVTNYPVTVILDTNPAGVYSNMSASVNVIVDSRSDVLEIPISAVQNQNGQSTVRVLENGVVSEVPVETGLSSDTNIEITSGLSEGQDVVTSVISPTTSSSGGTSIFGATRVGGFNRGFGGR